MKEMEKDVMCVLLQRLLDKNLITPKTCEKSKNKILDTFDSTEFFCYAEKDRKENADGHT